MTLSEKDYVQEGINKLLAQFTDKPLIESFLSSYLKQLEKTQEDSFYLLNNRSVFNATGVFLDQIGKLVGEKRAGNTDTIYRQNILNRIIINNSQGTPEDVLSILKLITGATTVKMFEHYPANLHLFTDGIDLDLNKAVELMNEVVVAGVGDVTIIADQENGVFTPSELDTGNNVIGTLSTDTDDTIVTDDGDNIIVIGYGYSGASFKALLAEFSTDILQVSVDGVNEVDLEISINGIDSVDLDVTFFSSDNTNVLPFAEIYNEFI